MGSMGGRRRCVAHPWSRGKHQGKIASTFVEVGAVDDLAQREYGLRTGFRRAVSPVGYKLNHDASSWTMGGGSSWIRFETLRVNI